MGVDALEFVVVYLGERTKLGFEKKKEKLSIQRVLVYQINLDLFFRVRHGAKMLVFALFTVLDVHAKLFFVVVWMIQLFDSVVRVSAPLISTVWSLTKVFEILKFHIRPSSFFFTVVVLTHCIVVGFFYLTRLSLEIFHVRFGNLFGFLILVHY